MVFSPTGWNCLVLLAVAAVSSGMRIEDPTSSSNLQQQTQALQKALGEQQKRNSDQLKHLAELRKRASQNVERRATLGEVKGQAEKVEIKAPKKPRKPVTDPFEKKALLALKARHPEAGVWAGYKLETPEKEPTTAEEMAAADYRKALSSSERVDADAYAVVNHIHNEVTEAFKLPGPLVYVDPPLSRFELNEVMRKANDKAVKDTFKFAQKSNERQAKLNNAIINGFKVPSYGARKINKPGIFCTTSLLQMPSLMPAPCVKDAKLFCDPQKQKCVFHDNPKKPKSVEIAEPPILCAGGDRDCAYGEAAAEAEYRARLNFKNRNKKAKDSGKDIPKRVRKLKEQMRQADLVEHNTIEAEVSGLDRVLITQKVDRYPVLSKVDPLESLKTKVAAYDDRLQKTNTIVEELNLLAPDCDLKFKHCKKVRCKPRGQSQEAIELAALCYARCGRKYEICVITKIKKAQAGVKVARQDLDAKAEAKHSVPITLD